MKTVDHDAIIIGGGLGGLAAAAVLAAAGRDVCLIKRHDDVGGCASVYDVDGLTIEAALHETADPRDPLDPKHHLLTRLGLLDKLEWIPVGPLYAVRGGPLGDTPFELCHGFDQARQALSERFGDSGVNRVLDRMEAIGTALRGMSEARERPSVAHLARALFKAGPLVSEWKHSVSEVFDSELGGNEAVKCALAANLPYYGNDPAKLWWIYYAVAQYSYISSGGCYLKGGSASLTGALKEFIIGHGGAVLTGREAIRMQPPDGEDPGEVEYRDVKTGSVSAVRASAIVANCAPHALNDMLPEPARPRFFARYEGKEVSNSVFGLHFGVRADAAGILPRHYSTMVLPEWMKSLSDYAAAGDLLCDDPRGKLPPFALVNYNAIDAGIGDGNTILLTVTGLDSTRNWSGMTASAERARRDAWTAAIEAEIERHWPGFSAAVTHRFFVSATSMQRYLGTPDGAIYGFAALPPDRPMWSGIGRSPKTALDGVFLASSFAGAAGYSGSMGTGAMAGDMVNAWLHRRRSG
ncbi:phytoene desaturase family protein [Oricola nitratireducens]|uniref:phytoene desaturase family protein n=1 Tax=Oricola nitratireducens TaxID=2775868 RepID=UPI0018664268|nr:NAD(P)-binding protein [Oricola nitratireducens]